MDQAELDQYTPVERLELEDQLMYEAEMFLNMAASDKSGNPTDTEEYIT